MTAALVRPIPETDVLVAQLRDDLAVALTPEAYDAQLARALQNALTDCLERKARYRRMRRAVVTISRAPGDRRWL